jgi:hypothetical protein
MAAIPGAQLGLADFFLRVKMRHNPTKNVVTGSRREQENERVRLQFRSWRRRVISWSGALLERRTSSKVSQALVALTLFLWLLIFLFGVLVLHQPQVAIVPLYAFYPGELVAQKPGYNPTFMHAWAAGAGILCLVLAILATRRRNKSAAITLMVFFLVSTLISCARVIHGVQTSP